ncbi:hypothetical protein GY45DRAFT_1292574 [Cubamyces sp. BRFM 1775]|nr:hypothetical protein GY45DRAFT_1292574 [Cubamyces sp. BRFM 1775]
MWWPSVPDHVSQDSTVGVYVLGTILAAMFYGLTFLQNLQYFDRYRKDCLAMKFFILVLWLFDSTTMALSMQAVYIFAVARRNLTFASIEVPESVEVERAFSFAVVFMVQMYFVGRIWQLGRRYWYLPAFIGLVSIVAFVTGLAATVQSSAFGLSSPHPAYVDGLSAASAALQIATDVMINATLYWLCSKCKHHSSKGVVRDAMVNIVNRGLLSTLMQVMTTITYFVLRPRLVWMSFHMASSKVHAMSLLSTLNSRDLVRGVAHDAEIADAQIRYRLERELNGAALPERPPIIPSLHQLRSQSSWFANGAKSAEADDMKSATDATGPGTNSASVSVSALSRGPSVHARSTTAVDGV